MKLENNIKILPTPETDIELLRVLYNWKANQDKENTAKMQEKTHEIYLLHKELAELKKLLREAQNTARKQQENPKNTLSLFGKIHSFFTRL
jgi:superfamily I DNA and/or RNA helicase